MLDLGLARIAKLVTAARLPWRAIHVAGTNGKGSVCSYTSSMLKGSGVSFGQFTSPHLIDRWDCISLDGRTISESIFRSIEQDVARKSNSDNIGATEFEQLTATAFEAFSQHGTEIGVVEVGMGGRLDATNILQSPLACVITKIGLDHQSFLGNTLEEVATQKAGIIKNGVPCFVDGSNPESVQEVISAYAREVRAKEPVFVYPDHSIYEDTLWRSLSRKHLLEHQQVNLVLAYEATKSALSQLGKSVEFDTLAKATLDSTWPGRLQHIDLSPLLQHDALLDGAHNPQAAEALGSYVDKHLRKDGEAVTWLVAMTEGKDLSGILSKLVRNGDKVVTTSFGPVDGMPWIKSYNSEQLLDDISPLCLFADSDRHQDVESALQAAGRMAGNGPLVITGSLYLASDILRLLRNSRHEEN